MAQQKASVSTFIEEALEITEDSIAEVKTSERRMYARRNARWASVITTRDKRMIQCRALDVSERGASISSPVDFKANALFVLEMSVRYKGIQKKLRILSEVKRSAIAKEGFTLGLYFKDASETAFDFLKKYSNSQI